VSPAGVGGSVEAVSPRAMTGIVLLPISPQALGKAEDEEDIRAASQAKAEQVAELAEFNENIPLDGEDSSTREEDEELSKAEQEIAALVEQVNGAAQRRLELPCSFLPHPLPPPPLSLSLSLSQTPSPPFYRMFVPTWKPAPRLSRPTAREAIQPIEPAPTTIPPYPHNPALYPANSP